MGHVLLKPNPKEKKIILDRHQQIPRLVLVSARHEPGILSMIDKVGLQEHYTVFILKYVGVGT